MLCKYFGKHVVYMANTLPGECGVVSHVRIISNFKVMLIH